MINFHVCVLAHVQNTIGNLKEDNVRLREYKTAYDKVQEGMSMYVVWSKTHLILDAALSVAQPVPQSQPANYKVNQSLDQPVYK